MRIRTESSDVDRGTSVPQVRSLERSIHTLVGPLSSFHRTCGAIDPRTVRQACQTGRAASAPQTRADSCSSGLRSMVTRPPATTCGMTSQRLSRSHSTSPLAEQRRSFKDNSHPSLSLSFRCKANSLCGVCPSGRLTEPILHAARSRPAVVCLHACFGPSDVTPLRPHGPGYP